VPKLLKPMSLREKRKGEKERKKCLVENG